MNKFIFSAILLTGSYSCLAEDLPAEINLTPDPSSARWALGVGATWKDSIYAGEDGSVSPLPLVIYDGDQFFIRGTQLGWTFMQRETLELSAITSLRLDGFDIDDLGEDELATNGLDYRLLEDRDDGVDVGLSAQWQGSAGVLELELLTDISNASDGHSAALSYGYPFKWGRTTIAPNLGITWLSSKSADYYYGTLDEEIERGVLDYRPGSVVLPSMGLTANRMLGDKWGLFGSMTYTAIPDEIQDSPLVDPSKSGSTKVRFGISRRF